jgi:hypothetical protein
MVLFAAVKCFYTDPGVFSHKFLKFILVKVYYDDLDQVLIFASRKHYLLSKRLRFPPLLIGPLGLSTQAYQLNTFITFEYIFHLNYLC